MSSGEEPEVKKKRSCSPMEVMDQAELQKVQDVLESGDIYKEELSESQCSALAHIMMSGPVLDDLCLCWYKTTAEGRRRLIPVVKNCSKVWLECCSLSDVDCAVVPSALTSSPSHLKVLDLSYNNLSNSFVSAVIESLKSPNCQLYELILRDCGVLEGNCASLVSALKSNPSTQLIGLVLSDNRNLSDSGVKHLCGLLQSPDCRLKGIRLDKCGLTKISCSYLASALKSNHSSQLTHLDLMLNDLKKADVKELVQLERSAHSPLEIFYWQD